MRCRCSACDTTSGGTPGSTSFFTLTTILVNFVLAFILIQTSDWTQTAQFGLLHWLPTMPLVIYVLVGLSILILWSLPAPFCGA